MLSIMPAISHWWYSSEPVHESVPIDEEFVEIKHSDVDELNHEVKQSQWCEEIPQLSGEIPQLCEEIQQLGKEIPQSELWKNKDPEFLFSVLELMDGFDAYLENTEKLGFSTVSLPTRQENIAAGIGLFV